MNTRFKDSLISLMASYIGLIFYYSVNHDPPSVFYDIASIVIIIGCFIRSLYLFHKETPKKIPNKYIHKNNWVFTNFQYHYPNQSILFARYYNNDARFYTHHNLF